MRPTLSNFMIRAENESGNFGRGRAVGGTKRGHGIVLKVLPTCVGRVVASADDGWRDSWDLGSRL